MKNSIEDNHGNSSKFQIIPRKNISGTQPILSHVRTIQKPLLPELLQTLRDLYRQALEASTREDFKAMVRIGNNINSSAAAFRIYAISDLGREIEVYGMKHHTNFEPLNRLAGLLDLMKAELE